MTLTEFLTHLRNEPLSEGDSNILAAPATDDEIAQWQTDHPDFPLPDDYQGLLKAANGIRLHASAQSPIGLLHLLPLDRLKPLSEQVMEMSGLEEEELTDPPTCLMVGEDQDSQWCLGLDTANGHFLEVGYTGDTTDLGPMPQMLDWLVARLQG